MMTCSLRSSLTTARRPVAPAVSYVVAGKLDRRAIMQRAVNSAFQSRSSGRPWRVLMSECLRLAWSRAKAELALFMKAEADRTRRLAGRPHRTEADLMVRLTRAQNLPHNAGRDVMTWAAMCDSRAELERHVLSCEAKSRPVYRRPLAVSGARAHSHAW